ncbi:fasciclin-1-like isoform X2 [Pollicipes pollicipes]|uniref:fasciclin-1-like isoform X2 n=1 Tax=Pollicipes pollicipes TaxID=41117 RepID=UPI0018855763|nr:fasciclin-1-like isoform X2 [Pollicipes pollicipes]
MWTWRCVVLAVCLAASQAKSVNELMAERPELSEFLNLLKSDQLTSDIMRLQEGTVFAPTNEAMAKYQGVRNYQLLKYHMVNVAQPSSQLVTERSVLTRLKGSQAVFVTVQPRRGDEPDIFVNNARLVTRDLKATSEQDGSDQILHIIDEVLEPTIPNSRDSKLFNPNALELLSNSAKYRLGDASIKKFYEKVQQLEKIGVFDTQGFHTYFIPVDEGLDAVLDQIDRSVLDGHVIPDKVLFTRTMGNDSYKTTAFGDMLKVTVQLRRLAYPSRSDDSFFLKAQKHVPEESRPFQLFEVESKTLVGDSVHQAGTVLVKVIKPNIAVKNGVVHIIQRPLMVMDSTTFQFIQDGSKDRFFEFFDLLQNHATDFLQTMREADGATFFIPSNEAFYTVDKKRLTEVKLSPQKLRKLLSLHLVRQRVTTENIRKAPRSQLYTVQSADTSRSLYISLSGVEGSNLTMTVEGGGTNASVTIADIVVRDGVVHVIDKLLGVPYRSLGDKLAVDSMMSSTSALAAQDRFGDNVRRMDRKFTMFVPSNLAWEKLKRQLPTSHKSLFSGKASYQATNILERHLVIGHAYNMEELVRLSLQEGGVKTFKTLFHVENVPGTSEYVIKWEGMQARVTRTNVECTNGYIHVIDGVMMRARDVTTSGAPAVFSSAIWLVAALLSLRL